MRASAYRPQDNSALERVHSTLHNRLAMHPNAKYDNWAELLTYFELAHSAAYLKNARRNPTFFKFSRRALIPVDIVVGVPSRLVLEHDSNTPVVPLKTCNSLTKLLVAVYRNVPISRQSLTRNCPFRNISREIRCWYTASIPLLMGPSPNVLVPCVVPLLCVPNYGR